MDYRHLREQYPAVISKDQFYQICHISKRKALWLLEHGIVPCQDSGKKTRRFKIRLEDVIDFLERRDAGALEGVLPRGIFSSQGPPVPRSYVPIDREALCGSILAAWENEPDMLTAKQAAKLCGCSPGAVLGWARKGTVASIAYYGVRLVSKESLAWRVAVKAPEKL